MTEDSETQPDVQQSKPGPPPLPPPLPKSETKNAPSLGQRIKQAGQLTAKQAHHTKLTSLTLPSAHRQLGKKIYQETSYRDEFPELFSQLDQLSAQINEIADKHSHRPEAKNLQDKAKGALATGKDLTHKKSLELHVSQAFAKLGEAAYGRHKDDASLGDEFSLVAELQSQLVTLDTEIASLSEASPDQLLTPKRIAIGVVVMLGVGILGQFVGDDTSSRRPSTESSGVQGDDIEQADTEPQVAEDDVIRMGDEFTLGDYKYVVKSVYSTRVIGSQFMQETASDGATYVVVGYTIENCTNESQTVLSEDFELVDAKGRNFSPSSDANTALLAEDNKDFLISQLQPGIARSMKTAFEVPQSALDEPVTLVIPEKGFFSSGKVTILIEFE